MLGRLRIELKQTIPIFAKLVNDVFSDRKLISTGDAASFKATKLEAALKKIVRDATGDENTRLMDTLSDADDCKTYVSYTLLARVSVFDR
jgi:hypothetical protein